MRSSVNDIAEKVRDARKTNRGQLVAVRYGREDAASAAVLTYRHQAGLLTGEPEYLDPLKEDAPEGWYVTGYPWYLIKTPEHMAFLEAYQKRYSDYPRISSVVGYATIKALAAGMAKAGSTNTEALIKAFEGLELMSPSGKLTFRALDHQSTLGLYVGRTALQGDKGVMTSYDYLDGAKLQPSDADVRKRRPAEAQ